MTQRTRTEGSFAFVGSGLYTETFCNGSINQIVQLGKGIKTGTVKTTNDIVTSKFHSRIRDGEIINNPYSSTLIEKSGSASGSHSSVYIPSCSGTNLKSLMCDSMHVIIADTKDIVHPWDPDIVNLEFLAGTQAAAGIIPADVMGMVDLIEIRKTLDMIRNPFEATRKFVSDIRRSKRYQRSKAKSVGEFISSNWLQYRYGILPLLSSMNGIIEVVTKPKTSVRHTSRGFASGNFGTITEVGPVSGNTPGSFFTTQINREITGRCTVRTGVLYEHVFSTTDRIGFSLHDIPSTAWELIPYSFVADWFANTGDLIRALTPKAGVRQLACWTRNEFVLDAKNTVLHGNPPPHTNWTHSDSRQASQVTKTTFRYRQPGIRVGFASELSTITFERPKDWNHLADAFSLFTQSLTKR